MKKTILNKYYQVLALDEIKTEFSTITKILDKKKSNFHGINEVYSSTIKKDVIRAWKKHTQMICNIVVIKGSVKFIFSEDSEIISNYEFNTIFNHKMSGGDLSIDIDNIKYKDKSDLNNTVRIDFMDHSKRF